MTIAERVADLNSMILNGQILEAFEKHYAQEVVMADNFAGDRVGKEENRKYEESFVGSLTAFRGAEVLDVAIDEAAGLSFVKWHFDFTHAQWGDMNYTQVAVQQWKDGKIVHERFIYGN